MYNQAINVSGTLKGNPRYIQSEGKTWADLIIAVTIAQKNRRENEPLVMYYHAKVSREDLVMYCKRYLTNECNVSVQGPVHVFIPYDNEGNYLKDIDGKPSVRLEIDAWDVRLHGGTNRMDEESMKAKAEAYQKEAAWRKAYIEATLKEEIPDYTDEELPF